jgi:ubiquinone biosynthesis protein Coq4
MHTMQQSRRSRLSELLQQWRLYARGAYQFVRRPVSRQTFTALSEALVRFRSNSDAVAFMLQDPRVAQLCRERYTGEQYKPEELLRFPPGSLGHEFGAAMIAEKFDPEFYRDYYGQEPYHFENDEQYLRFRIRQVHDIVHVLTGFGMNDIPGELGMQAFNAAQTRRPFSIALVGFGLLRIVLRPKDLPLTMHQIAKGLAMGYAADQLMAYRYEEDWSKPVAEWRKELRLVAEQDFEFVAHRRGQSDPASAGADAAERLVP